MDARQQAAKDFSYADSSTDSAHQTDIAFRHHRFMLMTAMVIVLMACLLEVQPEGRVAFCFLPGYPLPHTCFTRSWLGVECPGCGLTRSFIYLAQGRWAESWAMHRVGGILAIAVVLQFPYRLLAMTGRGRTWFRPRLMKLGSTGLIALLIGNWVVELFV